MYTALALLFILTVIFIIRIWNIYATLLNDHSGFGEKENLLYYSVTNKNKEQKFWKVEGERGAGKMDLPGDLIPITHMMAHKCLWTLLQRNLIPSSRLFGHCTRDCIHTHAEKTHTPKKWNVTLTYICFLPMIPCANTGLCKQSSNHQKSTWP